MPSSWRTADSQLCSLQPQRAHVYGKRLLSMPKPNNFVFKFLKTKIRNFWWHKCSKFKISKSELINFLFEPAPPCLSVWLMTSSSRGTKPLFSTGFCCQMKLSWMNCTVLLDTELLIAQSFTLPPHLNPTSKTSQLDPCFLLFFNYYSINFSFVLYYCVDL